VLQSVPADGMMGRTGGCGKRSCGRAGSRRRRNPPPQLGHRIGGLRFA